MYNTVQSLYMAVDNRNTQYPENMIVAAGLAVGWHCVLLASIHTFVRPTAQTETYIPSMRSLVKPELDVMLYALSLIMVPLMSLIFYHGLHRIVSRLERAGRQHVTHLLLQCIGMYGVGISLALIFFEKNALISALFLLSVIATGILATILRNAPGWHALYQRISVFLDALTFFILFCLTLGSIYRVFFSSWFSSHDAVSLFRRHSYLHFSGFSPHHAAGTLVGILCTVALRRRLGNYTPSNRIGYMLDGCALLGIIFLVSLVIPTQNPTASVDYMFVIGPAHDVLRGKTLLVNVHSQYGLLMIYALAGIFSGIPLHAGSFFFLNYTATILGYTALYFFVCYWLHSRFYAWITIMLLLQQHYFAQEYPMLFYSQPTFLRFGMWIPVLAILATRIRLRSRHPILLSIELFLVGIAAFWGFDVGVYVVGAYCVARAIESFQSTDSLSGKLRHFTFSLLQIGATIFLFFCGISLFTWIRSGQFPDWRMFPEAMFFFTGGWGLLPMPKIGIWQVIIGGHLLVMLHILYQIVSQRKFLKNDIPLSVLAFLVGYGCLQFFYYTGRSTNNNLRSVIVPFLLLLIWFLHRMEFWVLVRPWRQWTRMRCFFFSGTMYLLLLGTTVITTVGIINIIGTVQHKDDPPVPDAIPPESSSFQQSVLTIAAIAPEIADSSGAVAILSEYDGEVLTLIRRTNVIDSNILMYFPLISSIDMLGKQLAERNPQFVLAEHNTNSDRVAALFPYIQKHYHLSRNIGFFDVWERN